MEAGSDYSSVSAPYNVQHEIHVDFDQTTGYSVRDEDIFFLLESGITS